MEALSLFRGINPVENAGHAGADDPDGVENLRGIADRGVPRSGDLEVRRYSDDRIHRSE